jgi:hypothetical protein
VPTILVLPAAFGRFSSLNKTGVKRLCRGLEVYYELLSRGIPKEKVFFVSTVKDKGPDGKSQSEAIKEELSARRIPEDRIVVSEKSHNTWGDVINSFRLVVKKKLPQPVILVSNFDHIFPRTWLIAKFWGWRMKIKTEFAWIGLMKINDSLLETPKTARVVWLIFKNLSGKKGRMWKDVLGLYFDKENIFIPFFYGWPRPPRLP